MSRNLVEPESVLEVCSRHEFIREAAAELGILPKQLIAIRMKIKKAGFTFPRMRNDQRARRNTVDDVFAFAKPVESGCWEWTKALSTKGYGVFTIEDRWTLAHRAAFISRNGPIADEMLVLHRCDNPKCINPDHLFLGSHSDNMKDCISKGRRPPKTGSRNKMSRFKEADIIEMRAMRSQGAMIKDIAKKFSTSKNHVSAILNRRSWSHV